MQFISISGTQIKSPNEFDEEDYDITKGERTASGRASRDLIARKKKYNMSWKAISTTDYQLIYNLLKSGIDTEFTVVADIDNVLVTLTMYPGAFKRSRHRSKSGTEWIWKNFTLSLIEV